MPFSADLCFSTIKKICLFSILLLLFLSPPLAAASNGTIRIGILAPRPKPETARRFAPLEQHLRKTLPNYNLRVGVYSYSELEAELAAGRLDFVITNPGHYVQMRNLNRMSGVLATIIEQDNGVEISSFGGVIFAMADRADIRSLKDLEGKRIATVGTGSLGGYQAQAFELANAGIRLSEDAKLVVTGMPHDSAVQAVLNGAADVGMVRTSVLEDLVRENKLDLGRLKVLNRTSHPGYPFIASTRLYPQWPFVALPHVNREVATKVASALLSMKHVKHADGLHGFAAPASYASVEEVLRELRMPPFEKSPHFTPGDIWARYRYEVLTILAGCLVIASLALRLAFANRQLQESELRYRTVADFTSNWEFWQAPDGTLRYMSPACEKVSGYTAEEFYADPELLIRILHPDDVEIYLHHLHLLAEDGHPKPFDLRIIRKDGAERWLAHACTVVKAADGRDLGRRACNHDISDRKFVEKQLFEKVVELKASMAKVKQLEGIIPICMHCKNIRDDKESWQQLETYMSQHTEAMFSHGVCPDCREKYYADFRTTAPAVQPPAE